MLTRLGCLEITLKLVNASLRRLVLLLEKDHLLLMTAHHLVHRFAVLVGDLGEFAVELGAEELLQLLLLLRHRLLVLFQLGLSLLLDSLGLRFPLLDLEVHVVDDFVQVEDPLFEPGRPRLALRQVRLELSALPLRLRLLLPLRLGFVALPIVRLV